MAKNGLSEFNFTELSIHTLKQMGAGGGGGGADLNMNLIIPRCSNLLISDVCVCV